MCLIPHTSTYGTGKLTELHRELRDRRRPNFKPGRCLIISGIYRQKTGCPFELLGNVAEARSAYERSLQLDPDDEQAKASLAKLNGAP